MQWQRRQAFEPADVGQVLFAPWLGSGRPVSYRAGALARVDSIDAGKATASPMQ